jgi:hypothetical protein
MKTLRANSDIKLSKDVADKSVLSFDAESEMWVDRPAGDMGLSTKNILIESVDWIDAGTKYTLPIPEAIHGQGSTIFIKTFVGTGPIEEVFVGWTADASGNIELSVVKAPDGRFSGIVSVCKLLLV